MGKIQLLDDHLINRIAAGEVVERPASVVKELVENSLDADACRVDVTIQGGGKRFIRVQDDGTGMDREDALLSIERHATSKMGREGRLDRIRSLGFRGEALPSIASVARLIIRTSERDGGGTEIEIDSGTVNGVRAGGFPRGTTVEVDRLFHNVPARRKFMRTDGTELGHIVKIVTRYALARPDVRFSLEHADRMLIETPAAPDLLTRIHQVFGGEIARQMVPFDSGEGAIRVRGFAGRPAQALPRRNRQHMFVNGRAVQDRVLAHGIGEAYGNTVPRGAFPAVVLFLDLEPSLVDVNVHPQKNEVRFQRSSEIHEKVKAAIRQVLSGEPMVPGLGELRPDSPFSGSPYQDRRTAEPVRDPGNGSEWTASGLFEPKGGEETAVTDRGALALAQYLHSYIIAQDKEGLLVVDQHAAHERVIFERYFAEAEKDKVEVQRLMFPRTLELTPPEAAVLNGELEEFRRLGFLIEPFGQNTIRLDGVPAHAAGADPESLIHELLGDAARVRSSATGGETLRYKLVTTAACHAAIKIHHPLDRQGMQKLLDDLYQVENLTTCPHGRPALFRLTREEVERAFRRR